MSRGPKWTEDHSKRLRELWAVKPPISRVEIARTLTSEFGIPRSPNAVIGQAHRLHLKPRKRRTLINLNAEHARISRGRSIFKPRPVEESPRLLVEGKNNVKLGKRIEKGAWKGMPVFTLTLEERATCPRSCPEWVSCYGNSMHMARRHAHGDLLEDTLAVEVMQMNARHPAGFVVRLHVLGDFYSVGYVGLWRKLLARFSGLRVWGYTAYDPDASDLEEARIGTAIADLRCDYPDRFRIRLSGVETRVANGKDDVRAGELLCPAEISDKATCSSCAWCWERKEPVVFIRHGLAPAEPEPVS